MKKTLRGIEDEMAKLTRERDALDKAMNDPASAEPRHAKLSMGELNKRRAEVVDKLAEAESRWMEAGEAMEAA